MHGQKTRFGKELPHAKPGVDYPIKVHISGKHYRKEYFGSVGYDVIYADAVMNGKKVELKGDQGAGLSFPDGNPLKYYKLPLGDYQARLLKDSSKVDEPPLFQVYELVLPDKTVWRCTVTGISE
jgi:hypothetical protein